MCSRKDQQGRRKADGRGSVRRGHGEKVPRVPDEAEEKLDTDVEAGKIHEEAAKKTYENAERGVNEGMRMLTRLKKVREELEALCEAGKIRKEGAIKRCS